MEQGHSTTETATAPTAVQVGGWGVWIYSCVTLLTEERMRRADKWRVRVGLFVLAGTALMVIAGCAGGKREPIFGTVASSPERAARGYAAGLRVATYEVFWDRLQPVRDRFDESKFDQARQDIAAFRDAGLEVVLSLGVQYPPAWAFEVPNSRYVNQYGEAYVDGEPGANGLNAVFNQEVRDLQADYIARAFQELGDDFYAVRLGWGYYGELSYPSHTHNDRPNAYWGFDDVALGRAGNLANTLSPNPVPDWKPGDPSPDHGAARQFAAWYLDAMTDYQNWQIETVRQHYGGRLAVLYPSWGLRPGQLDAAVDKDLSGFTAPELNGEIQRGHDFSRHVAGLPDPEVRTSGVVVYTTWLDASPAFGDDGGQDPVGWSPVHFLAALAEDRGSALEVWGENTGWGSVEAMALCFDRLDAYDVSGLFWAFEEQLFEQGDYATLEDYAALIAARADD